VEALRQRGESALPNQARPAVPDQRTGDAGEHRQGDEDVRIEAAGGDEQPGGEEDDLPGSERQRHTGLLGEKEAAEEHDGDDAVQALEKVQGSSS